MGQSAICSDSTRHFPTMVSRRISVLLVLHDTESATAIRKILGNGYTLSGHQPTRFCVTQTTRLDDAIAVLKQDRFTLVLVEPNLPDACGWAAVHRIQAVAPNTPIIALTAEENEITALQAIRAGAQDCLSRQEFGSPRLIPAMLRAVERERSRTRLRHRVQTLEAAHVRLESKAAELAHRNTELNRINHELEQFTYVASHDLKEPLRGIHAYCDLLGEDYRSVLDQEGQRRLGKIDDLCCRLENLISDLLTYCRVGSVKPVTANVSLDTVVANVLDMLRPSISGKKEVRVHGPLPGVCGDETLLTLAIGNLVSNGLKFNRSERPTVEIGTVTGSEPTLYVRDNGIGIEPRYHEAIFAMFRRLHSRKEYEGSGAGLSIVQRIIKSLGGRVWLDSEPSRGATFYLTLPPATPSAVLAPPHWLKSGHVVNAH